MPNHCRDCEHIFAEPLTKDADGKPAPPRFSCYCFPPQIVLTPQGLLVAHPSVNPSKVACGQFKVPFIISKSLPPAVKQFPGEA